MPAAGAPVTIVGLISTVLVDRKQCKNTLWRTSWQSLIDNGYMTVYDPPITCTTTTSANGDSTETVSEEELVAAVAGRVPTLYAPIQFSSTLATTGVTATDRAYGPRTITGARMRAATAPTGSSLTVQVQHFGGVSWTTLGTLTIADGSTVEAVTPFAVAQTQNAGDLLRLNITSVGSNTVAGGVAVDIEWAINL